MKMKKLRFCVLIIVFFISLSISEAVESVYYSIHLASFKDLENTNKYLNSLTNKGKLVFWKEVNVPGEGIYYRVYLGKYLNKSDAIEFFNKLKADGGSNYFGVHRFTEIISPEIAEKAPATESLPIQEDIRARPLETREEIETSFSDNVKERFTDNLDGTVTDNRSNLMWIKNGWRFDFFSALTFWEAVKKCKEFRERGFSDWRLPTIGEWKTLIDQNKQHPAMVEPNPFENIIAHMPYWSQSEFVYSKSHSCNVECPLQVYTVMLYSGNIHHQQKSEKAFVLPVRSIK